LLLRAAMIRPPTVLVLLLASCGQSHSGTSADAAVDSASPDTGVADDAAGLLPSIAELVPAGSVTVGRQLVVLGANFDYTIGAARLYVDGLLVNSFTAGSDSVLVVDVPDLPDLPADGRSVAVTVDNRVGSASKMITVAPAPVTLSGFVDVHTDPAPAAQPGQQVDIPYDISSRANEAATFRVVARLDVAWAAQVLDAGHQPVDTVALVPFEPIHGFVRVTVPDDAQAGAEFDLTVEAVAGGTVFGSSGLVAHHVGDADPPVDSTIAIEQPSANPPGSMLAGDALVLSATTFAIVTIPTTFSDEGSGTVSVAPVGSLLGWQLRMQNPAGDVGASSHGRFQATAGISQLFQFAIQPGPNATATGVIELAIQRDGSPATTRRFPVVLLP
jgi:hypothetical protein